MPVRHAVAQGIRFSAVLFIDASSPDRDRNEAPESVSVEYMPTTHTCARRRSGGQVVMTRSSRPPRRISGTCRPSCRKVAARKAISQRMEERFERLNPVDLGRAE